MKLQEYNAPEIVPVSRKGAGGLYLCRDVDPVIRELRAKVLYEKGLHNLNMANRIGVDARAYEKRVRIGYLQLHYAQLIRENRPGWWQS